jgi:hypothetical protein
MGEEKSGTLTIAKEEAVFWMDGRGRWCNQHGRFAHKGIIDHFNRCIRHDGDGFYLTQERDGLTEKVYFRYEETAVFVVDVRLSGDPELVLNTGDRIALRPERHFVFDDQLFQQEAGYAVKYTEGAMMQMGTAITVEGDDYFIELNGKKVRLRRYAAMPDQTA